jgi:glycerol-3-phosphate dehydrogenase
MHRDLSAMASAELDLLIIGGGISGSTIARDASQRGLKVGLVEMKDFSHGTSSASTKLVHGGLRYLANFEFGLVREALKERRIWERIAPHMVDPLPFMVPNYGSRGAKLFMQLGFFVYDLLSFDRNWLKDKDKHMPGYKRVSAKEALERAPGLDPEGLIGGTIYYDCQMYSPERLGLECLKEAESLGAHIANYAEVVEVTKEGSRITGAIVEDKLSGEKFTVKARMTVNASGPWADYVLRTAEGGTPSRHLIRSKGIHFITKPLSKDLALLITRDENHVLFIPWRGHTIIGTTDTVFAEHPDKVTTTEADIDRLLSKANQAYPNANLTKNDIQHFYAGLRPLVDTDNNPDNNDTQDTYGASRAAEIVDHESVSGTGGLLSAIGGKWTTSRHIAQKVVDKVIEKLGPGQKAFAPCQTMDRPTFGGAMENFASFTASLKSAHTDWPEDVLDNLAKNYGSRAEEVIALCASNPSLKMRLAPGLPNVAAEILYAIDDEMALTFEDVLFRRTGIGTLGNPGPEAIEKISVLMAKKLCWSEDEISKQVQGALTKFETGLH